MNNTNETKTVKEDYKELGNMKPLFSNQLDIFGNDTVIRNEAVQLKFFY